jgi:hypothetical protein
LRYERDSRFKTFAKGKEAYAGRNSDCGRMIGGTQKASKERELWT